MINSALNLFKVPPTDRSIDAYRMVTIQPTTTGINPIEFVVPGLDSYVDLNRSYFTMKLGLKKSDGNNLVANETLFPVNNLAHSIIKQIDLHLNGTLISPQSDTYHYKAYFERLLNYDRDGETVLKPAGWFNQIDAPPAWTANKLDHGTPHADYRGLSANQTYVKTCFPWVNTPRVFHAMLTTLWPSKTLGINWGYVMCYYSPFQTNGKIVCTPFNM